MYKNFGIRIKKDSSEVTFENCVIACCGTCKWWAPWSEEDNCDDGYCGEETASLTVKVTGPQFGCNYWESKESTDVTG